MIHPNAVIISEADRNNINAFMGIVNAELDQVNYRGAIDATDIMRKYIISVSQRPTKSDFASPQAQKPCI